MNQEWFEMKDIRKRNYSKSVWIPLRAVFTLIGKGKYGYEGYKNEFFGSGSIAVPIKSIKAAKKLGWMDIGISHQHSGHVEDGVYIPADIYKDYGEEFEGIHLILDQMSHDDEPHVWHLNQDLVLALGLKREGNSWVCPQDGYTEVARLRMSDGSKLFRVLGELWRNEIIEPGKLSPKVRGDEEGSTVYFIIDAEGSKLCGRDLIDAGKWLWFKPEVIMALYHRRGGALSFYTQQTGSVSCLYGYNVHFGVNDLGLVNVYAKDVGLLPEWQQQIWAGYNITPEGGVSSELLASQVRASPANTQAPEEFLGKALELVNELSSAKIGIRIFRDHEAIPSLLTKSHRFRSVDETSFYALAKDLARLIADSLDADAMQTIVPPPKKTKWGSLKSLENLLASKYDRELVRKITAPLVGIYELRHADAHLPGSEIEDAFKLINIDRYLPFVHQGYQMLHQVVSSIYGVAEVLKRWPRE